VREPEAIFIFVSSGEKNQKKEGKEEEYPATKEIKETARS
jgi:hypothetical protein